MMNRRAGKKKQPHVLPRFSRYSLGVAPSQDASDHQDYSPTKNIIPARDPKQCLKECSLKSLKFQIK